MHNDTAIWYRYIDMTPQAEALYLFIEHTIDTELRDELTLMAHNNPLERGFQVRRLPGSDGRRESTVFVNRICKRARVMAANLAPAAVTGQVP